MLSRYRELTVGAAGWGYLVRYELCMLLFRNLPGALGFAAALGEPEDIPAMAAMRARLDQTIAALGGEVVAPDAPRAPHIASYRMPGVSAAAQLIRFDLAGIAVSAGSACSSGTLKTSPVLKAMGWDDKAADEVVRVSFGRSTTQAQVQRFIEQWRVIAGGEAAA